jgi:hypothetical protein
VHGGFGFRGVLTVEIVEPRIHVAKRLCFSRDERPLGMPLVVPRGRRDERDRSQKDAD